VVVCLSGYSQSLKLLWTSPATLKIPESVCYDERSKVLFVSNIDGKPDEKDGKGFISKLAMDGTIKSLEWVKGLHAPKGMAIYKNKLYVADVTRVVAIESSTGKITHTIDVPGAQFLNDLTVDGGGKIYVSDSQTGNIFVINNLKPSIFYAGKEFKRVNGLLALKDGLYVADAGTGVNYIVLWTQKLVKYAQTAVGADGVVKTGHDEFLVSAWDGEIYFVDAAKKATKLLSTKDKKLNAADIDYDHEHDILFIPTFYGNCVMAYSFKR
jgi:sugar lactone lactonase YvrE